MRNMLMVGAASFALLGATQAMAQTSNTNTAGVGVTVELICQVNNLAPSLTFSGTTSGSTTPAEDFQFQCNDPDGATIGMGSQADGLVNSDNTSVVIEYTGEVTTSTLSSGGTVGGTLLSLDTDGTNPALDTDLDLNNALEAPGVVDNATVQFTLSDSATLAGAYSDTVVISIDPIL